MQALGTCEFPQLGDQQSLFGAISGLAIDAAYTQGIHNTKARRLNPRHQVIPHQTLTCCESQTPNPYTMLEKPSQTYHY